MRFCKVVLKPESCIASKAVGVEQRDRRQRRERAVQVAKVHDVEFAIEIVQQIVRTIAQVIERVREREFVHVAFNDVRKLAGAQLDLHRVGQIS